MSSQGELCKVFWHVCCVPTQDTRPRYSSREEEKEHAASKRSADALLVARHELHREPSRVPSLRPIIHMAYETQAGDLERRLRVRRAGCLRRFRLNAGHHFGRRGRCHGTERGRRGNGLNWTGESPWATLGPGLLRSIKEKAAKARTEHLDDHESGILRIVR